MSTRRWNETFFAGKMGGGSALLLIAGVMLPAPPPLAACTFTWQAQCGSGNCGKNLTCWNPSSCTINYCKTNWDDGSRWDSGDPPCMYSYPLQDGHDAVIERSTGGCTPTEDWLRINLVNVTIDDLTITTASGTSQVLDLRFESKDTTNALTVDNRFTVDGVNGDVSLTVQDDAFVKAFRIKFVGGTTGTVTVTVTGGAKIETYLNV